ncbi:SDR family oxidoreductase [Phenylobacterium sp.]|uniref:SDR family oxidoreductase n=1 Tax=Phenylobacterium sp. TaxID=1871053 RepID=UPI002BB007D0|nr:SDR family oxidoreductase [Phenylobacterium sp.]HVI30483.1 SDR family oxidoreductase [Phenylobacterium sp.]
MADRAAIVIGAGDALGGAIARRFAREAYAAVIARRHADQLEDLAAAIRDAGGEAHPFGLDARQEDQVTALFDRVEAEIAPVEVCVFNIGANVRFPIAETTARVYFKVWEMAAFAGFLAGREAARRMTPRGKGTILFTGATASVRGREGFAAFSGAKHALRALAQSMARELGPKGIHVAHTIIDGAIDTAWIAENFPERYALKDQDGILNPDHIAEAYWMLHAQPRDAWTHELDLRPWTESF